MEARSYVALGENTAQIAARLHLAPDTVNGRLMRIYRKLDLRNRNEAAFKAWKPG